MAQVTLKGNPFHTCGDLPKVGSQAPAFTLTRTDLSEITPADFPGQRLVLNIFPSIDTPTCATSVRTFNAQAGKVPNTVVLCISADLPFAAARFCTTEGLDKVVPASVFRNPGVRDGLRHHPHGRTPAWAAGPLRGGHGPKGKVLHTELVGEIAHEPNYEAALAALK